ncbi:uncharacterized protein LOC111713145 [Eurytemora carolleeae]|uniref:uncharacterized protein LOC111713145 n=1 Tax=Eurytemora carolleeae TaxID=1294199 RepID=UPI000C79174F|nr:uncharacterized protein LOC111713145 [Eurytemora carolleeae]|eukprot:XP_023343719.1 uncharacterized protein LOC111713145 [Eurytemora affinis]
MQDKQVYELRKLERKLFNAWCRWLCYPSRNITDDNASRDNFISVLKVVDQKLLETPGPYFLAEFSVVDSIFIPYVERMHASLFYYKGFSMRDKTKFPGLTAWFSGIESRDTYMGTQSDFHTHVHDLPPQMGGCYENGTKEQEECKNRVDSCTDFSLPESSVEEKEENKYLAAERVLKFKDYILQVNPCKDETIDEGLRCALTYLLSGQLITPPPGCDVGLRYIKERINVPRDMSLWSARRLREALELTAAAAGSGTGQPIPSEHRRDQNPANFGKI